MIDLTPNGSITIRLAALEQSDSGLLLEIAVEDSGIGMEAEILEQIFTPFTQADSSTARCYGGTGLGLTISRRLAELMGGSLGVESRVGRGSSFRLRLPLALTPGGAEQKQSENWPVSGNGPALEILLAEDHPVNIKFARVLLEKLGHKVTVAENGRQALDAIGQKNFDLVLMDIQMPVMNGEEALAAIRDGNRLSGTHLPVIALTAHALKGDQDRFLGLGFDGCLSKPVEVRALADEIGRVTAAAG